MNSTTYLAPTAATVPGRVARIVRHPLGWLAVGIVAVGAISSLAGGPPAVALSSAAAAVVAYWAVLRFVARRLLWMVLTLAAILRATVSGDPT